MNETTIDMDFNIIKVGDKVEYFGDDRDDTDLFEYFEDNGFFFVISNIDKDAELLWGDNIPFAIQAGLVRKL